MKLCVLENLYAGLPFEQSLAKLASLGVEALEIGAGGYPGKAGGGQAHPGCAEIHAHGGKTV